MSQLELDFGQTAQFGITAVGVNGRTFRLMTQTPEEQWQSSCTGCAFDSRTCEDNMPSNECTSELDLIWKEISQE